MSEILKISEWVADENQYSIENDVRSWIENWDFAKCETKTYTHRLHNYPAIFIPQLVRKVVSQYSSEGDLVLDIFNGSGTTSVECTLLNRRSIGIELNPLANLIAKVKTTIYDQTQLTDQFKIIEDNYKNTDLKFKNMSFPNIEFWYSSTAIVHLSKLSYLISEQADEHIRNFFLVAFSKILREISNCKHSGFKMHRDLKKLERNITHEFVWDYFHKAVQYNINSSATYATFFKDRKKPSCVVLNGSSTEFQKTIKKGSVDLIVTSPPYGDSKTTVAYGQFSRLSSQWLGLISPIDPTRSIAHLDTELLGGKTIQVSVDDEIVKKSITLCGVITQFNAMIVEAEGKEKTKLVKRLKDILSFYIDLDKVLIKSEFYLKSGGYFVLVTASRIVKGVKLHTDQIIAELVEENGIELKSIMYRNIPNKRMPRMVSATNVVGDKTKTMTRESVIILKKRAADPVKGRRAERMI